MAAEAEAVEALAASFWAAMGASSTGALAAGERLLAGIDALEDALRASGAHGLSVVGEDGEGSADKVEKRREAVHQKSENVLQELALHNK